MFGHRRLGKSVSSLAAAHALGVAAGLTSVVAGTGPASVNTARAFDGFNIAPWQPSSKRQRNRLARIEKARGNPAGTKLWNKARQGELGLAKLK